MLPRTRTSSLSRPACGSRSHSTSSSASAANVTGDRELLWSRIRDTDSLQSLLAAIEAAGFHPLVLPRASLLRKDAADDVDFGAILGQLGIFGAILDCKSVADSVQRELTRLELNLIKLGVTKISINLLCRHLEVAKNVGKAFCLVIDDRAPPATTAKSVFETMEASRHLGLVNGGRLPAIIFGGGGESDTLTRIEDRDVDAASSASSGDEQSLQSDSAGAASGEPLEMQHKLCRFTDLMLVAYENSCGRAQAV
ncbi:hypothetical protein BOX15_Mlig007182g1 [Macrostomum lignano]|uniref:Uncharacterized protein n=1 Tax=Macrostomum lignano TaxID=282301 RepID=A0A267GW01_9PLAT|nr:hypothetical protein BOX15_Mlig007182g1 [Macrostomum lignano]